MTKNSEISSEIEPKEKSSSFEVVEVPKGLKLTIQARSSKTVAVPPCSVYFDRRVTEVHSKNFSTFIKELKEALAAAYGTLGNWDGDIDGLPLFYSAIEYKSFGQPLTQESYSLLKRRWDIQRSYFPECPLSRWTDS